VLYAALVTLGPTDRSSACSQP